jgi:AcrR family transcriptional regulator
MARSTTPKSKAAPAESTAPKADKAAAGKTAASKAATSKTASPRAAAAQPAAGKVAASPRRTATSAAGATAQVIPMPERPATPVLRRRRSNRRSEQTIENILACTEAIILESGAERISILDVCRAADVSRGTFYRYFASQDVLLDAFSRHKRERFHRALQDVVAQHAEPDARFTAIIGYLDHYLQHGNARRLLMVAPEYALGFFKRIFHDSVVRFQDALGIVFDAWEERLGVQIDRELVAEMLIRYVLSEQLVPSDGDRKAIPRRIGRMVDALLIGAPARARR